MSHRAGRIRSLGLAAILIATTAFSVACEDEAAACESGSEYAVTVAPQWNGYIRACVFDDTSVHVVNVSSVMLTGSAPAASGVRVAESGDDSLEANAVRQLVGSSGRPGVLIGPGATLIAENAGGASQVFLDIDQTATMKRYVIATAARWVQGKVQSPGDKFVGSVIGCAEEISASWQAQQTSGGGFVAVEVFFLNSIRTGLACRGLADQVSGEARIPPPAAATWADELRGAGKDLRANVIDDALAHLRRLALVVR